MADVDLTIKTGVTWRRSFVWSDANGARISLAGKAAKLQIRQKLGSPPLVEVSTANGYIQLESEIVAGSADGVITITIPGPLTTLLRAAEGVYDLKITTASTANGEPSARPLEGKVIFDLAVTQ